MMEYRNSMVSRKNLKYLSLNGMMGDQDSALALKAMTNAIRVSLRYVSFNHQAHTTLIENHANTIVYLDISLCADTSGTMAQEILSRCPSLEYFGVDHIRGTDLVRIVPSGDGESENIVLGQEWVCLRLKSLIMYFDMSTDLSKDRSTSESKVLFQRQQKLEQLHVFRQLSRLCALEILDIRGTQPRPTNLNLKLRTKGGELETLKTLKKLRKFLTRHPFDDESVGWIKKNWPNYEF
ncbi:hypothetical protein BGZ76_003545 [Entomortierella beljakovae]|nr:hypothetical protein BGZ76_003545 [Entomortierella beljakovae]